MSSFIRWKEGNILGYLPFFISRSEEFKVLNDADSREHERLRLELIELLNQCNVQTATYALSKWEEFVDITANKYELGDRRNRVIAKLNNSNSSTEKFLEQIANKFIYDKSADITPLNEKYMMDLNYTKDMCDNLDDLYKAIEEFKPAHIGYVVWEEQEVNQNLIVSAAVGAQEEVLIEMIKPLGEVDVSSNIFFHNAIGTEEITVIGG